MRPTPSPRRTRAALAEAEVLEETEEASGLKELLLAVDWRRSLHVVVVVDETHAEERIVTVYEPDPTLWAADYRRRQA